MNAIQAAYKESFAQYEEFPYGIAKDNAIQDVITDLMYALLLEHFHTVSQSKALIRKALKNL